MHTYTIHPIVMGTKVFDQGMMTYQPADILLPLHEPRFAGMETIGAEKV